MATLLICGGLRADDRVPKLVAALSQQADLFQKLAPQMVGEETLFQRALGPAPKYRRPDSEKDKNPPPVVWQERRIVSEYAFALLGGSIHETRRVTSVDGRPVEDQKKAQESLVNAITASGDARKKQLLVDFAKHGLRGAVTDLGQLLLLFNSRDIEGYEFSFRREELQGAGRLLVFSYKQIDGPDKVTVFDADKRPTRQARIQGEVWVRETTYEPVRISFASQQGDGEKALREEATVDYAESPENVLLPVSTEHREFQGGQLVAENKFGYSDFRRFSVTTKLKFDVPK